MVNMSLNWSWSEAAVEGADEAGREGVDRLNLRNHVETTKAFSEIR